MDSLYLVLFFLNLKTRSFVFNFTVYKYPVLLLLLLGKFWEKVENIFPPNGTLSKEKLSVKNKTVSTCGNVKLPVSKRGISNIQCASYKLVWWGVGEGVCACDVRAENKNNLLRDQHSPKLHFPELSKVFLGISSILKLILKLE